MDSLEWGQYTEHNIDTRKTSNRETTPYKAGLEAHTKRIITEVLARSLSVLSPAMQQSA